jgi:hypothetical protein
MAIADEALIAALAQPLERVAADRLQHPEPRRLVGPLGPDEALVDERSDAVEGVAPRRCSAASSGEVICFFLSRTDFLEGALSLTDSAMRLS